jgi:hypothetical protein
VERINNKLKNEKTISNEEATKKHEEASNKYNEDIKKAKSKYNWGIDLLKGVFLFIRD